MTASTSSSVSTIFLPQAETLPPFSPFNHFPPLADLP
jgi:hypothetical protein